MTPSRATGYTPFFMVYSSKAILSTNLDYGALRLRAYDEQGTEVFLEDAMNQLDEAHDVALLCLAMYQQALRWYHTIKCGVEPSTSGTWCSALSRATRTATISLRHGRDCTSSRRCSNQAPISSRP